MTSIYERLQARETLWVKLAHPYPGQVTKPFQVKPLLLFGDSSVSAASEWARWARVGGVVINCTCYPMEAEEMQEWCSALEAVEEP